MYSAKVIAQSYNGASRNTITTMEVVYPRFILPEVNTHRILCLHGDTKLTFDHPKTGSGNWKSYHVTMEQVYKKMKTGVRRVRQEYDGWGFKSRVAALTRGQVYTAKEAATLMGYASHYNINALCRTGAITTLPRVGRGSPYKFMSDELIDYYKDNYGVSKLKTPMRVRGMRLRQLNESDMSIQHTHIVDVVHNGKVPMYEVTLKDGKSVRISSNHRVYTNKGWQSLDSMGLHHNKDTVAINAGFSFAANGVLAYKDEEYLRNKYVTSGWSAPRIAEECGVTVGKVKSMLRKYKIRRPDGVRPVVHSTTHSLRVPWNKGKTYRQSDEAKENMRISRERRMEKLRKTKPWQEKQVTAGRVQWIALHKKSILKRDGYRCAITGRTDKLQIHHIDPVFNSPAKVFDIDNVITLCAEAHMAIHSNGLEFKFMAWLESGERPENFDLSEKCSYKKPKSSGGKLIGHFVDVASVHYIGEHDSYDLEVEGPYHNFFADGICVHNSKSTASSRAIPVKKMLEAVKANPFVPEVFGGNRSGMQAGAEIGGKEAARDVWLKARDKAVEQVEELLDLGVHKQLANRLLEPFSWTRTVLTSTEWCNFFNLRLDRNSQPEFQILARVMKVAMLDSEPTELKHGEFHLPYIDPIEKVVYHTDDLLLMSSARCARVSYRLHDGTPANAVKDIELAETLIKAGHMSPFDHPARAEDPFNSEECRQYRGFSPYRVKVETGNVLPTNGE